MHKIISLHMVKSELIALLLLCSWCHVAVIVLCFLLKVPRVGLQGEIVAFPGHTNLLSKISELFEQILCQNSSFSLILECFGSLFYYFISII